MNKNLDRNTHRNEYTSLRSIEDYLVTIWQLSKNKTERISCKENKIVQKNKVVHMKDIAEKLQISSASVSLFVRKLEKIHKIIVVKRKGVILTTEGEKDAEQIANKHQLIECFLVEILRINQEKAYLQSHTLEHVMQPEIIHKLHTLITSIRGQCTPENCHYKQLCKLSDK